MNELIDTGGEHTRGSSEDARPSKRGKRSAHLATPKYQKDQRRFAQLTDREMEVMREVIVRLGDKEIADKPAVLEYCMCGVLFYLRKPLLSFGLIAWLSLVFLAYHVCL